MASLTASVASLGLGWWLAMSTWSWFGAYLAQVFPHLILMIRYPMRRDGRWQMRRQKRRARTPANSALTDAAQMNPSVPPVTILRPLRGVDENLEENLMSTFTLLHPSTYEVIFCVQSADDPCIPVAERVQRRFPHRPCRILIGCDEVGVNPKINNLLPGYRQASHDLVWICDSNVLLHPTAALVACSPFLQPGVGLVHHAPEGIRAASMGARLEQLFLNTAHTKIYLVINWTGLDSCVMGKSILFRRSDMNGIGGLQHFGRYLAEDNMIGIQLMRMGRRHVLAPLTVQQPLYHLSVTDYILRRCRWTRIRAYAMPAVTLLEPFTESLLCGLVGAWGAHYWLGWSVAGFLGTHMVLWLASDLVLMLGFCQNGLRDHGPAWTFLLHWCLRECLALPIFIYAILGGNRVEWRGTRYRLQFGGTVTSEPVTAHKGRMALGRSEPPSIPDPYARHTVPGLDHGQYVAKRSLVLSSSNM